MKRCLSCLSITLGILFFFITAEALAIPQPGPGGGLSTEAWIGLIATGVFFVVGGFTARNNQDIRDLRDAIREVDGHNEDKIKELKIELKSEREMKFAAMTEAFRQEFGAIRTEQRQQQTQLNLLSERVLREHPSKDDIDKRFDKLEALIERRMAR